jgi:hypothetical protein
MRVRVVSQAGHYDEAKISGWAAHDTREMRNPIPGPAMSTRRTSCPISSSSAKRSNIRHLAGSMRRPDYVVTAKLPERAGEFEYRIQHLGELFERIAIESQLREARR